jgi:hypothetical protein
MGLTKIALIVSLCSGISPKAIDKHLAALQKQHPKARVTVRLDNTGCPPPRVIAMHEDESRGILAWVKGRLP